ncbi:Acyl transferase OS=Tsukamurella paurometabola (strain ATCC 8368 / DSM / CCUG 35730 / CIP 100753/ JCM 10117 / KCTC 9821 / NBRC 16120 / NCIMB 702349 / NCTC 13040) OX=521096 GN=Tpau_3477 PE=4 SV=1 [Tsukamurella paurometabola]|uniref:Acyl transferase n=1 Tax=Tsukamurella paurometabola (strain ATCC 8368 / DSM 20162 / CCUG 35730 / CIP 100753 / JCM 10117 / KCTC 9821 / NBRC 16120 / NCIMB 702349 / NCTC 13040) TaxID=521096 RepID=D5UX39_TSUPD|nr:type I polyketide synthase [Tsukamurella paurometabola]ADG80058.1 Acyl transferase [Tsukamurella paurometabola DSM 20162]SUP38241.1 Erythronolide synthase, modules 3 and 4 [Tsukamurella paurometabola]
MTEHNAEIVEALRNSLKETRRLRARNAELTDAAGQPIAIVSMACRYPGGVTTPEALYELAAAGRDVVGPFPGNRFWDLDGLYSDDPDEGGTCYTRSGGFLYDADRFDPGFFGISPREAATMDPQQRISLEVAWEACERSGLPPERIRGSATGVYVGSAYQGYGEGWKDVDASMQGQLVTGMSNSIVSGRLAYTLGLTGPAITVDTACSSSLVAVHLAVTALRRGEIDMALAGGVAVIGAPIGIVGFARQRGLAADGRCKAFGASGDGMGFGEGAGLLFLVRLSDAVRDGLPIQAVIRGSSIGQDGASNGLSAPNGVSQRAVIEAALADARLHPDDIDAVEAHGTGTKLGDPVEADALIATFRGRPGDRPLYLGSVKSNIAHAQAASGVAGIIKMVGAMQHRTLPATLHAHEPNPLVDWDGSGLALLTETRAWPEREAPARCGVSSFGLSGTNAHVVLEAPADSGEPQAAQPPAHPTSTAVALPVFARTPGALPGQRARIAEMVGGAEPADVALSLARTRVTGDHVAIAIGTAAADLASALEPAEPAGVASSGATLVTGSARRRGGLAFVFPGQGSQWPGMAAELLTAEPVFARALADCDAALAPHLDRTITDLLTGADEEWLARVDLVQPALWAVMVSLAELWKSYGITPDAVIGHSQGEIAAAVVAGALSLDDGARVVALRSRAILAMTGATSMLSLRLTAEQAEEAIAGYDDVFLAAVNSPESVIVAGARAQVEDLAAVIAERGVRARLVNVDYASHTPFMEPLAAPIQQVLDSLAPVAAAVPFYSALTGGKLDGAELDGDYWYRNLRNTVRFDAATRALVDAGITDFIEISAHPVLRDAVEETAFTASGEERLAPSIGCHVTLRRDTGHAQFLTAVAGLAAVGYPVDWERQPGVAGARVIPLPTYAFDRRSYWLAPPQPARPVAGTPAQADSRHYRVRWEPTVLTAPARPAGRWLIIGDGSEHAKTYGHALADRISATLVHPDGGAGVAVDWESALREHAGTHWSAVVILAFDADPAAVSGRSKAFGTTVDILRAIGTCGLHQPLWVVTANAVAEGLPPAATIRPGAAQLWGLRRILFAEEPGRGGGIVDLALDDAAPDDPAGDAAEIDSLVAVLTADETETGERQIAVRAAGPLVRRLVPAPAPAPHRPWTPRGTVLVTGGAGGIGAHVVRELAARGAERIVIASRRGADSAQARALRDELADADAELDFVACDVCDRAAVATLVSGIDRSGPALTAVVHAAGVLDDRLLADLTPESADVVFGAKAGGAIALDEACGDRRLDAFVLFSSLAGSAGGAGQGSYAAANAHLDALAEARAARGSVATSIGWGAVDAGLVDAETAARLRRGGVIAMPPAQVAADVFSCAGGSSATGIVADIDWPALISVNPDLVTDAAYSAIPAVRKARAAESPAVVDVGAVSSRADVAPAVTRIVAEVLGLDSTDQVSATRSLRDSGVDSVSAVDLRNRLAALTGLKLAVSLVFDYPTVTDLADHLADRLFGGRDVAAATDPVPAIRDDADDPIVIVSMACRLPGGVDSPEALWSALTDEIDMVGPFPDDRGWDFSRYDPDPAVPGTYYVEGGGFLYDCADFDPAPFSLSPREALAMDPQHRLLLETSWEAFERAGIDPTALRNELGGVYVGASYNDYGSRSGTAAPELEGYLALGSASSVLSGRISYTYGLQGPSLTVDTACSSSLVALHMAAESVRQGECDFALAGGTSVMSTMDTFIEFSRQRVISRDGRCRAFSRDADGAGWAEGVAVVVLERRSRAVALGHPILAEIAGSAVNSDGASNGLTAPNGPAQQRVITAALRRSGLRTDDVDVVEAHGTGTPLGDPIEVGALSATYGAGRHPQRPLYLGALKASTGHTQAASGLAGVVKTVLMLTHGTLPRSLHSEDLSDVIDFDGVAVLQQARPWPEVNRPRRAAVSAFGVSGTNAHVILAQPGTPVPAPSDTVAAAPSAATRPIPVSATTAAALTKAVALVRESADRLGASHDALAAGLARHRPALAHRAALWKDRLITDVARTPRVGFVFSGQGTQWTGMGEALAQHYPAFAAALDEVAEAFSGLLPKPLLEILRERDIDDTAHAQPAVFAVEVALARLLESFGVTASAVCGHSIGEVAAAHIAGVLSLDHAARLIADRGRLMSDLPAGGIMAAVAAPEDRIVDHLAQRWPDAGTRPVAIAAVNGAAACVLSGPADAVRSVTAEWRDRGVKTTELSVSHAFHSPLMAPMLAEFGATLDELEFHDSTIPVVSSVTGGTHPVDSADYWSQHVGATVRFADAADRLRSEHAIDTFIEVGPDSRLAALLRTSFSDPGSGAAADLAIVGLMTARTDDIDLFAEALGRLWTRGAPVDLTAQPTAPAVGPQALPTYAFDRSRYWLEATAVPVARSGHPILGQRIRLADGADVYPATIRAADPSLAWIADHTIQGSVIYPGTGLVDLMIAAGTAIDLPVLDELTLRSPVRVTPGSDVELQIRIAPEERSVEGRAFTLHVATDSGAWTEAAHGRLAPVDPARECPDASAPTVPDEPGISMRARYAEMAENGFDYGPAFRGLDAVHVSEPETGITQVTGTVALPEGVGVRGFSIHPALLDAALHTIAFADLDGLDGGLVPFSFSATRVHRTGARTARVRLTALGPRTVAVDLYDEAGQSIGTIGELALRPAAALTPPARDRPQIYDTVFEPPQELPDAPGSAVPTIAVLGQLPSQVDLGEPEPRTFADIAEILESGAVPDQVLIALPGGSTAEADPEIATATHAAGTATLALIQQWAAADALYPATLIAVATHSTDGADPAASAAAGLWRSAINEYPGQFGIIDIDDGPIPADTVRTALTLTSAEPNLAISDGTVRVPRLRPVSDTETASPARLDHGTVVITGASGTLGEALARHLAREHRTPSLLLVSRRGADAPGAAALAEELAGLGTRAEFIAADVADADSVRAMLAHVPTHAPLSAVVHAAGVLSDGVLSAMTPRRLAEVYRAKVDAVLTLHRATRHLDLDAFVVYSSIAGVVGSAGQGNYASANAFLDAFARGPHSGGRTVSVAWGLWAEASGMTSVLDETDRERVSRAGLTGMSTADALALLDAALPARDGATIRSAPVIASFDTAQLGELARSGDIQPVFRALAPGRRREPVAPPSLAQRLTRVAEEDRLELATDAVAEVAATVLGYRSAAELDTRRGLLELGFDSLTAIELRNRLGAATGLRLPATLIFDYPSAAAIAAYLIEQAVPQAQIDESAAPGAAAGAGDPDGPDTGVEGPLATEVLADASDDEIFRFIDSLG